MAVGHAGLRQLCTGIIGIPPLRSRPSCPAQLSRCGHSQRSGTSIGMGMGIGNRYPDSEANLAFRRLCMLSRLRILIYNFLGCGPCGCTGCGRSINYWGKYHVLYY